MIPRADMDLEEIVYRLKRPLDSGKLGNTPRGKLLRIMGQLKRGADIADWQDRFARRLLDAGVPLEPLIDDGDTGG